MTPKLHRAGITLGLAGCLFLAGCGGAVEASSEASSEARADSAPGSTSASAAALSQESVDAAVRGFDDALSAVETAKAPAGGYKASDVGDLNHLGALAHAIYLDLSALAEHEGQPLPADDSQWPMHPKSSDASRLAASTDRLEAAARIAKRFFLFGIVKHLLSDSFTTEHATRVRGIEKALRVILDDIATGGCPECITPGQ